MLWNLWFCANIRKLKNWWPYSVGNLQKNMFSVFFEHKLLQKHTWQKTENMVLSKNHEKHWKITTNDCCGALITDTIEIYRIFWEFRSKLIFGFLANLCYAHAYFHVRFIINQTLTFRSARFSDASVSARRLKETIKSQNCELELSSRKLSSEKTR